ncbi:NifU family protein [Prauserella cavernicola]|uniref:NifU family protein n=1 Tax=Prauserella cavernicola TaxID=2800127 RepID=A0A934QMZ5_9PSEU|nr:NifU family protein [Prauserella cavernicola]MBK1784957.1 NifU family protein [Prauserella cavernicola]
MADAGAVAERVEQLLGELDHERPQVREIAAELVRTLMGLYGAGLTRVTELADERGLDALAADPLVSSLLVLHDLHPRDTEQRVAAALDEVRPYLGSHAGDVEVVGIDDEGVLRLRLTGTCDGCPSSAVTAKYAIEDAVRAAAPELTGVEVAGVAEPAGPGGRPLLPLDTVDCPVPR